MAMIAEMGYETASSDAMARAVFLRPEVQRQLAEIAENGREDITPSELRVAMAGSDQVRKRVNQVMHPQIRSLMEASSAQFHEVPLLIEACLQGHYEEIWVVTCGPVEQRRRLIERLDDEEAADALILSQLSSEVKKVFASEVIRTEKVVSEVQSTVRRLIETRSWRLSQPVDLP
jgi:dephospho-CoA kinase